MLPWVSELAARWREQADAYEADGFAGHAVLHRVADELERRAEDYWLETLTIAEAAKESGYSPDRLYRLIKRAQIANVGEKGAPRVRRGDLPRKGSKPRHQGRITEVGEFLAGLDE